MTRRTSITWPGHLAMIMAAWAGGAAIAQEADETLPLRFGKPELYNDVDNPGTIDSEQDLAEAAGSPGAVSADDLSREMSNPNSPLSSLTFKHIVTTFKGDLPDAQDQSASMTLFQPTFPFPLDGTGTTNLFVRPALAYVWRQPVYNAAKGKFENIRGFSDLGFDVAIGRSWDSGAVLVGGIQGTAPLYSDVSGEQWRLGPEMLAAYIGKKYFVAGFPSHQWNVAGEDYEYSTSSFEVFAGTYLPNAWTVMTDSVMTYDWVNDRATVPVNLTVRKVTKIGNLPVSVSVAADYFVEQNNTFGEDWRFSLNITPIVPNFVLGWLK